MKYRFNMTAKLVIFSLLLIIIPSSLIGIASNKVSENELNKMSEISLKNNVRQMMKLMALMDENVKKNLISLEDAQEYVKEYMLGPINEEGHRPINKDIDLGENGYFVVMNEKGKVLSHPRIEGQDTWDIEDPTGHKFVPDIIEAAKNGGGFVYHQWTLPNNPEKFEEKVQYAEFFPEWGWVVQAGSFKSDYNHGAKSVTNVALIILAITLLCSLIVIYFVSRKFTRPIGKIQNRIEAVATGDLTVKPLAYKGNDEIGQLARSIDKMVGNMRGMIGETDHIATQLTSASETISTNIESNLSATNEINMTMEEIASGSTHQSNLIEQTSSDIQKLGTQIHEIETQGMIMKEESDLMVQSFNKGMEQILYLQEQSKLSSETANKTTKAVEELNNSSANINDIIATIVQIADQTNLLSLNAAIEAARAGEHGKGFAVVADEVRQLADQTKSASEEISKLINHMQRETQHTVSLMKGSYEASEKQQYAVNETEQAFRSITGVINKNYEIIDHMINNVKKIVQQKDEIIHIMSSITTISYQTAVGSEEVNQSLIEQTKNMDELTKLSDELDNYASLLHKEFKKFNI